MKKFFKLFAISIMLTIASFGFVGCDLFNKSNDDDNKTQLKTPSAPVIRTINNVLTASTSAVENATSYQFTVNGVNFTVENPTLNCTDIILDVGDYTFQVTAVGQGKYSNSIASSQTTYTYTKTLNTPVLTINENLLSWTNVQNANQYEIFLDNVSVGKTTQNTINLSNEIFENKLDNFGMYSFYVVALDNGYYTQSEKSNVVSYKVYSKLSTPDNLKVNSLNAEYNLEWNSVENASTYSVECDGVMVAENISSNKFNVTELINEIRNYSFKVIAYSDNELILPSEFSESCLFAHTYTFQAPTISYTLLTDSVQIYWNKIQDAKTYTLYINGEQYNREIWATDNELVYASVTKNYLSQYSKPLDFKVKVNGFDNYLASGYSNTVNIRSYGKLSTPNNLAIEKNNSVVTLTYNVVENAESYTIIVNDRNTKITSKTSVDLSDIINAPADYQIKVKCNATQNFEESNYSTVYNYSNKGELTAPTNPSIVFNSNKAMLSWDEVESAVAYNVSFINQTNNTTKSITNINNTSYQIEVSEPGKYGFNVVAVGNKNYTNSQPSITVSEIYKVKLQTPQSLKVEVTGNNLVVSWDYVQNAESYVVTKTDSQSTTEHSVKTNQYSMDLSIEKEDLYVFSVRAVAASDGYYLDGDNSVSTSYLHGAIQNQGETYYYRGVERDFNIINQEEFNHVMSYVVLYHITSIELEILFDYTQDLADEYYYYNYVNGKINGDYTQDDQSLFNEAITALFSYNRDMGGWKSFGYRQQSATTFVFSLTYQSEIDPSLSTSQAFQEKMENFAPLTAKEKGFTARSASFDAFAIETLPDTETVEIYSTNQLVQQLAYLDKKPNFVTQNSNAEKVYNAAKEVLRTYVSDDMNDYEKVTAIFDYLVYYVTYDYAVLDVDVGFNDYYCYYAEGVFFNNIAVCNGIAKAFTLMCAIEGINSRHIVGYVEDAGEIIGHAWNKVEIDGVWYAVDATNGIVSGQDGEIAVHFLYFMVSDEYLFQNNFTQESIEEPDAMGTYNYYDNVQVTDDYDLYVTTQEELIAVIDTLLVTNQKTGLEFMASEYITRAMIQAVFNQINLDDNEYFISQKISNCFIIYKYN